jgi:hypothetical protein
MSGKRIKKKKQKDIIQLLREQGHNREEVERELFTAVAILGDFKIIEAGYPKNKAAQYVQEIHDEHYDIHVRVQRVMRKPEKPVIEK